jgi:hypothetical protein
VILDAHLGGEDRAAVATFMHGQSFSTPILLLTGASHPEEIQRVIKAQAYLRNRSNGLICSA